MQQAIGPERYGRVWDISHGIYRCSTIGKLEHARPAAAGPQSGVQK
jgi:hypothetical protein